jgi:hypothetical protein
MAVVPIIMRDASKSRSRSGNPHPNHHPEGTRPCAQSEGLCSRLPAPRGLGEEKGWGGGGFLAIGFWTHPEMSRVDAELASFVRWRDAVSSPSNARNTRGLDCPRGDSVLSRFTHGPHTAVDTVIASLGESVDLLGFGEALHGGEDILILRNRLFQRLVEAHGYSAIATESSFPLHTTAAGCRCKRWTPTPRRRARGREPVEPRMPRDNRVIPRNEGSRQFVADAPATTRFLASSE